ncbi:MAG: hypothetical protein G3M78_03895 [Candidatus Nitrohelix vancouverensis]|uniref:Tip attachment protein J domain-containing protein n=1 Tax=Candidatus Nitrohelix vancouverensis TaxID=2705534 RepID=A0A7T0C1C8_9BACT|nr:MAG: hypothetical protein G3M78_03895 [Candidatus Nitrohelix vancouverensis]
MRTDFTTNLDAARNKSAHAPATLLKLEWPAQPLGAPALTLYLSDRAGINTGTIDWFPLIENLGSIDANVAASALDVNGQRDLRVSVVNAPTQLFDPPAPFSHLFRKYPLEAGTATVYQWFEDEGLVEADLASLFVGRPYDPVSFDENSCQFDLMDMGSIHGKTMIASLIKEEEFPLAPESSIGRAKPIVIGSVEKVPAIPLRKAAETRVKSVVLAGGFIITVADTSDFPNSGSIIINDDEIAYASKNSTQFLGCTGINEFHYSDDVVLEKVSNHRYLLSDPDYPIKSISRVRAGGHIADSGDYTIDLAKGEVVFADKPKLTDSIDTKFLQAQMDAVAAGNNAVDPSNAFIPNSPATYAKLHQGATPLALTQMDELANLGEIVSALVRVEHFMEEKLTADSLTVEIPGIGELGELPPPAIDDVALAVGDVDITHDTLIGTLTFPVSDPQHEHALPQKTTITQNALGGVSPEFVQVVVGGANTNHTITFPSFSGTLEKAEYSVVFELGTTFPSGGSDPFLQLAGTGTGPGPGSYQCWSKNLSSGVNTYNFAGEINKEDNSIVMTGAHLTSINVKITSALRIITLSGFEDVATDSTGVSTSSSGSLAQTTGNKTLNVTSEKATKTVVKYFDVTAHVNGDWAWFQDKEVHVKYNGTSDGRTAFIIHTAFEIEYARRRVSFTDAISADVEGVVDDDAGTITGTPEALITRPDHVYQWSILKVLNLSSAEIHSASMSGAATFYDAGAYQLAGALFSQTSLRNLWAEWGRSSRSYFYWDLGQARIRVRPLNWTTQATAHDMAIDSSLIRADENGRLAFSAQRGSVENIVNVIDLKYKRDWSEADEPYAAIASVSDADSIARYGRREKPDAFQFDWLRDSAMAEDLANFYLHEYAEPMDVYEFELFLDHMELERGDVLQINPPIHELDSVLCVALGVGRVLGSGKARRMDSVPVTARLMRGLYANDGLGIQTLGASGLGGVEAI